MAADLRRPPGGRRRRLPATVRTRTTALAVAVVAGALVLASAGLVVAVRRALIADVRAASALRAQEVAAAVEAGLRPSLAVLEGDEQLVQVVSADGVVVAASDNIAGRPPVAALAPGRSTTVRPSLAPGAGGDGDDDPDEAEADEVFVAVAAGADTPDGRSTVIVARSLDDAQESAATSARYLVGGVPVLVAVVGWVTWVVVGRALAPVEAIRSQVERITASHLHRRVPEPASGDEVARLAGTMNRMLDRLEEAQVRQQRFVRDASHELRSPIASIRQHSEVALTHPERTTAVELAETVAAEARRMQGLVEDLLALARSDVGTVPARSRPVDVDDLVLEEARRLRSTTGLRIDATGVSAARVVGDEAALRRVLRNLGDNAVRHAASTVVLAVASRDGWVELSVEDDGPGIDEPDRARVFEPFVRLDEARARDTGGAGLGLAIVAGIVSAHGGTVSMAGGSLGGARCLVRLPVEAPQRT